MVNGKAQLECATTTADGLGDCSADLARPGSDFTFVEREWPAAYDEQAVL